GLRLPAAADHKASCYPRDASMYCSWIWMELCAPLISFMMFVTYCPCCPPGSLSGVSNGVTLSERFLKTLAATGTPAVLPARARLVGSVGGGGLACAARFARAFSIGFSIAG